MKNFTKIASLVVVISVSSSSLFAQPASVNSFDQSAGLSYAYAGPSKSASLSISHDHSETGTVNEKTLALLKYFRSEEFVFENLASLKKSYAIPDIFYDLDKAVIRADAEETLHDLVNLMVKQPELSVAVTAHCDSRMSGYNETLSVKRAQAAVDYLLAKGISKDRIVMEKHGRSDVKNPCATNAGCSLADQQLNRRTEFNIIVNGKNLAHLKAYNE